MSSLSAFERETVVVCSDGDDLVRVTTYQAKYIRRLDAHPKATRVGENEFTIPASEWNPLTGIKRNRNMTDEQKAEAAERLRKARQSNG